MSSVRPSPLPVSPTVVVVPPLEPGDHLTRDEFERRYAATPDVKKAELIEGVVIMPSPVRVNHHGSPHARLMTWLGVYWSQTPGVRLADNATIRLDLDNEPQPDATLMIEPACGGRAKISDDDYIEGAPELVAEVASSSVSFDLHAKLRVYRRNGVPEYLVWRVDDKAVDWFVLRQGQYVAQTADASGVLSGETFPGLWLDVAALTRGDLAAVLATLQRGLADAAHADFVARLGRAASSGP